MDLQIEFNKAAFFQRGNGYDILVFIETFRYQYGQGLGDVLRGIVWFITKIAQFIKPVAIKEAQTLLKAGRKAITECATVKYVINSTLKHTVGAVSVATVDQDASKLIEMQNNQNDAPLLNPPIVVPELIQTGSSNKRRRQFVYKVSLRTQYLSN